MRQLHQRSAQVWHALPRDRTVLPAIHAFIHEWNEPYICLLCLKSNWVRIKVRTVRFHTFAFYRHTCAAETRDTIVTHQLSLARSISLPGNFRIRSFFVHGQKHQSEIAGLMQDRHHGVQWRRRRHNECVVCERNAFSGLSRFSVSWFLSWR